MATENKPGRGKTTMMLATLKVLKNKGLIRKTLILAPLRTVQLTAHDQNVIEVPEEWVDFCDMTYTESTKLDAHTTHRRVYR